MNSQTLSNVATATRCIPNPYLVSSLYAITHFDSSQSDSTPYGPPQGTFKPYPTYEPIVYGGPVNIMTFVSSDPNYMWQVGTDKVSYVKKADGQWIAVDSFEALADASSNEFKPILDENFATFGALSPVGYSPDSMDKCMQHLFGTNYKDRFGNGTYALVAKSNVLYAIYADTLYGFQFQSTKIVTSYKLQDVIKAFQGDNVPQGIRIAGLSMTYDGHIIVTFSNGVGVIDRNIDINSKCFYPFSPNEWVSNSIAVEPEENNDRYTAIYIATGCIDPTTKPTSTMYKLIWTGTSISDDPNYGAWSCAYQNSSTKPPVIKWGKGTGSTPTLMGFGDDTDKLVVITDGAEQMNLVAFWRNKIPNGAQRIADQIQVTCGLNPLPPWIQSEQSVVVYGYGAFVVNNIPDFSGLSEDDINSITNATQYVQVVLIGPSYPAAYGVERFQWNTKTNKWSSVWSHSDISSTNMIPIHSQPGNMAIVNGWEEKSGGWQVWGLDWNTGKTVHQTTLGKANLGNGAYAILQYLDNQDLLFNSIVGPFRVNFKTA